MDEENLVLRIGTPEEFAQVSDAPKVGRLEFEEAKESEDLLGIQYDLMYVVKLTDLLTAMLLDEESEEAQESRGLREVKLNNQTPADDATYTERALWEAAIVAYARCFHGGKRAWLSKDEVFEGQPKDLVEWHNYFKNTRDKHVAHSVNDFEIISTGAVIEHQDGKPTVQRIITMHAIRAGEHLETVKMLKRLAEHVGNVVREKRGDVSKRLWKRTKALSPEEIESLPVLADTPQQGFEAAGKSRR